MQKEASVNSAKLDIWKKRLPNAVRPLCEADPNLTFGLARSFGLMES